MSGYDCITSEIKIRTGRISRLPSFLQNVYRYNTTNNHIPILPPSLHLWLLLLCHLTPLVQ